MTAGSIVAVHGIVAVGCIHRTPYSIVQLLIDSAYGVYHGRDVLTSDTNARGMAAVSTPSARWPVHHKSNLQLMIGQSLEAGWDGKTGSWHVVQALAP
jgi:hypothetical protein